MRCASCGSRGAVGARYCDRCGTALEVSPRPEATRQLGRAGRVGEADRHATHPAPHPAPNPAATEAGEAGDAGDRRIVTALFADLVDYVRMLAEHDPEVVRARVTAALATMSQAIERFDGTREKFIGDAVFAVFGWPVAHDDDAVRAALAAAAMRDGLRMIGHGQEPMEIRVGIATGEVVAVVRERSDGDLGLTGEAITTAARIQSLARPGEIVLDGATVTAARGRLATDDRGSVVLRGQSNAVQLHALRGEAGMSALIPFRASAPGPFVGRAREVAEIEATIRRCQEIGRGGVVVVVGEAGMGKTRLLAAVEAHALGAGFAWSWTENVSYARGEPYRWARLFAQTIADEQDIDSGTLVRRLVFTDAVPADAVRRYGGAIAAIARDVAFSGWEAEASDLLTDPAEVSAALGEVAVLYLTSLLESAGPRVVVIDDLHWLDASSAGMVDILIGMTATYPLLVLAGARPGDLPDWAGRPTTQRIDLHGLAEPETAHLATLVAEAAIDAEGARNIHERTAGNPLFVGETVRAFLEDGTLQRRDGRVVLAQVGPPRMPLTLRAVLGARIDALEPGDREALSVASVIGISFHERLVAELVGHPLEPGTLEHLSAVALINESDDGTWRFAHALIHDAAYAGLLASRRRVLHARLADHLEASDPAIPVGQLASHRVAAGDAGQALPLLREAAGFALQLGAAEEAAAFWLQAADLSATDDPAGAAADRSHAAEALEIARAGHDPDV